MTQQAAHFDFLIIGGGFFGTSVAIYLKRRFPSCSICIVEREDQLLSRASFNNQARVHGGYHYPRSFVTGYRSRVNLKQFVDFYGESVSQEFTNIYAISKKDSKTSAKQFYRYCERIGAPISKPTRDIYTLFDERNIEELFQVEEFVFNAETLKSLAIRNIDDLGISVFCEREVGGIRKIQNGLIELNIDAKGKASQILTCNNAFFCTYSGLTEFGECFHSVRNLKHELAEIAIVNLPDSYKSLGITVMDGPFFSTMPFPAKRQHSLTHVRYTPHRSWTNSEKSPYEESDRYLRETQFERMVRDAARFVPGIRDAEYIESLFEVKTVLVSSESDDSRPILFEDSETVPGCYAILGGKIDNIFDVFKKLDGIEFAT